MSQVRSHPLSGVIMAGAVGAAAVSAFMYAASALARFSMGSTLRFLGAVVGASEGSAALGALILLFMAFVWAVLYRRIREALPESLLAHGVVYGLMIWVASTAILWPLLAQLRPLPVNPGLFALAFGPKAALSSLLAHLLYGLVLNRYLAGRG